MTSYIMKATFKFSEIEGKNTIVSAQNSAVSCKMFINQKCLNSDLSFEEAGI